MIPPVSLCKNVLRYRTCKQVRYHEEFTYCEAMDQVKEGCKTTILDLFQASSAKKCRPNKGLDSPTPGPNTNAPNYATSSSEIGESHYLCNDKKSSDNCPISK